MICCLDQYIAGIPLRITIRGEIGLAQYLLMSFAALEYP